MEYIKQSPIFLHHTLFKHQHTIKERTDCILEPLQAILQLSCLAFAPYGTKLTIRQNILYIQYPSYTQGIIRWIQNDTKEDIYFIFHIFRRFVQNYQHLKDITYKKHNLYDIIIKLTLQGLQNLIETYNNHNFNIIHTLTMYKTLIQHTELFTNNDLQEYTMDTIFKSIKDIYNTQEYYMILHILIHMMNQQNEHLQYYHIQGMNIILKSKEQKIKEWIQKHCTL